MYQTYKILHVFCGGFLPFQTSLLLPSGEVVEVVVEIVEAHLGLGA